MELFQRTKECDQNRPYAEHAMATQPKKTRAEREEELRRLWTTPGGKDQVWKLFHEATGLPAGTMPRAGTLIFKTILDKEYPNS